MPLNRKIRYGMVGGGPDAFIGAVHRKAAALDGEIDLIAGAFSSSPEKSRQQGAELFLDPNRVYGSYQEMAEKESQLPAGERIDFVSIVTPNHVHFDVAKTFIEAGFHVVCDKPMTTTVADAETLCSLVKAHDVIFALTHNYTGYPMVKQARELVKAGKLGTLRKIVVEYPQGLARHIFRGRRRETSRLAHRSESSGRILMYWGHRFPRRKLGTLYHRAQHRRNLCRYDHFCRGTFIRRRWQPTRAL